MKEKNTRPYDNVSAYTRFSNNMRRFYFINLFLYDNIFSFAAGRGFTYVTHGEYLENIYGWIREFHEFTENYRKWCNEDSKEYIGKSSFASQISKLMRKGGIALPKDRDTYQKDIAYGDTVRLDLYGENDYLYIAKKYLQEKFAVIDESALEPVKQCVHRILRKEWNIVFDSATEKRLSDLENDTDYYEILSALLVFSQCGTLPKAGKTDIACNIFMSSKGKMQELLPLEKQSLGAKRITIINYAGTSLLSGREITYDCKTESERFLFKIMESNCETIIVLTDPDSPAASDAVKYKMRPRSYQLGQGLNKIIPSNVEKMKSNMKNYPEWDLKIYLTQVALPCAYFRSEFENANYDNIKIDLYLPNFSHYERTVKTGTLNRKIEEMRIPDDQGADDEIRQSFIVYRSSTPDLYKVFSKNIDDIVANSRRLQLP